MASIAPSAGKTLALLKTLNSRSPNPFPSILLRVHGFSSESPPESSADTDHEPERPIRPMRGEAEKLDDTLCHMMAQRPWTTRLQNSIRNLVPNFNQALVLGVLRGARHPDHALRFFRWVEKTGFRHDRDTYLEIISILCRNLMLNHARCILIDDMPKRAVDRDEDMFIELIQGYGRAGIPQEVVKLFRKMPEFGVVRTSRSYDAFFKAILRRGRVMMAKRFFNAMIRDGVAPTLSTYNTLLWGFSLCMKMDTANRFFDDMKMRGIAPDIVTYNMLLNGVDDGLRLFGEMREKGIRATEKTYAALMPGLCDDTERTGEARKVMDEMVERRMTPKDKSIFLRMISSMCRSQDLDAAMAVHRAMSRFRDVVVDMSHYGVLIEGLCNGKKYDKAVEILDELLGKGMLLNPQSSVIEPSTYNPMIEYLCGNGLTSKAEEFFRLLMKKGIDDEVAFNHLIRGHAKEEKPESAFELLNIMNRRGIASDADAYTLLVESYLKKRETADARTVLDSMIEQGHLPSSSLFRSVMVALFEDGRVQTASRVMKSMIDKGVKENMDIVHKILEALFMRGHVEEALGRINLLLLNNCAPDFDSLVVSLCDSSKAIEALKLVDFGLERDCDISFSSFDRLLEVLYSAGKILPAYSILCKIKAKGGVVDKKGCGVLIESLVAGGHTKQADILSRTLSGKNPLDGKKGKKIAVDA
ncbi:putative tetratricopeptide-like helical domain superfamily [Dioscorea sansibarensis]